jgi:hypothetical protein
VTEEGHPLAPGGLIATMFGCLCPANANRFGRGYLGAPQHPSGDPQFLIHHSCRFHAPGMDIARVVGCECPSSIGLPILQRGCPVHDPGNCHV